jgi:tripartite-type tricarboxylate transporter receptor subunit TctC
MFTNMASATAQVKSGRVRLIAIATMAPSPLLPDVPTVDAAVPGYESGIIYGFFGPVKTSPAIVAQLNKAVVETLRIPGIKKQILDSGAEPVGSTPEEFARVIEKEMAELTKLVKETDMKL